MGLKLALCLDALSTDFLHLLALLQKLLALGRCHVLHLQRSGVGVTRRVINDGVVVHDLRNGRANVGDIGDVGDVRRLVDVRILVDYRLVDHRGVVDDIVLNDCHRRTRQVAGKACRVYVAYGRGPIRVTAVVAAVVAVQRIVVEADTKTHTEPRSIAERRVARLDRKSVV